MIIENLPIRFKLADETIVILANISNYVWDGALMKLKCDYLIAFMIQYFQI